MYQVKLLATEDVEGSLMSLRQFFLAAEDAQVLISKSTDSQDVAGSYDRYSSARRMRAAAADGGGAAAATRCDVLCVSVCVTRWRVLCA